MFACTFINRSGKVETLVPLSNLEDIEQILYDFLMSLLGEREKEEIFEQISSPDQFRIILEESFIAQELDETENFIYIRWNAGAPVFLESYKPKHTQNTGSVRFSLNLCEKGIPIGTLIIDCLRESFKNLCLRVKEERALRLEQERARKEKKQ